jgi:hypothetical protein
MKKPQKNLLKAACRLCVRNCGYALKRADTLVDNKNCLVKTPPLALCARPRGAK